MGSPRAVLVLVSMVLWPLAASANITPMVFFEFRESSLSENAVEVLHETVLMFRETHYSKLRVTGYCDTAEMVKDCPALARRRAEAAKSELVRIGIDADCIETGVSMDLPVPTAPAVREPQNRRVVVDFPP